MKVIFMLAVHELEEIYIGDLTQFQITKEEKEKLGHTAVQKVLDGLLDKEDIESMVIEFDERKTKEADFAYHCDKLECDLQCKLYDEEKTVDLNKQWQNPMFSDSNVQRLLKSKKNWSEMLLTFGQNSYNYDENFTSISNYAMNNNISRFFEKI